MTDVKANRRKSARYVERPEPGIEVRHRADCARAQGKRCSGSPKCRPRFLASIGGGRKRYRRQFPSLAAAQDWRRRTSEQINSGEIVCTSATFREAATEWVREVRKSGRYKPSTLHGYERSLDVHLLPAFGARRLHEITGQDVRRLVQRLRAQPAERGSGTLSGSYVRNTLMPMRAIYRQAIDDGRVTVNPLDGVSRSLPPAGKRTRFATPHEAHALLTALDGEDLALWSTAMHTGLRRGELQALRWEFVDLAAGKIRIRRSWDERTSQEVAPKSAAGWRDVPIPPVLRDLLVDHKLRGMEPYVFGREGGQRPFNGSTVGKRAKTAWKKAGVPVLGCDSENGGELPAHGYLTLHECRHTYASLMIEAALAEGRAGEFTIRELMQALGHSSITVTMDRYGHLLPGGGERMAASLQALLDRANTGSRIDAIGQGQD